MRIDHACFEPIDQHEVWELVVKASPDAHARIDEQARRNGMTEMPPVWTDELRVEVPAAHGSTRPHLVAVLAGDEWDGDAFLFVSPTRDGAEKIGDESGAGWYWLCDLVSGDWEEMVLLAPPIDLLSLEVDA